MILTLRLALISLVLLTSLALGSARGQLLTGQTVVLCAGGSVTVAAMGAGGAPVQHTQVCPDMAPAFLAGFDSVVTLPPVPLGTASAAPPLAAEIPAPAPLPVQRARDPPSLKIG